MLKKIALVVLIPLFLQGCFNSSTNVKPDPRLTADIEKPVRKGDTFRDVLVAYTERGAVIDEFNCRMRAIRGDDLGSECLAKKE
jgi:PBP1b-binding outer membrane lipoprotein LpoB